MNKIITLRDALVILFKHKWIFAIACGTTIIAVTVGTFLMTSIYQADSTLLLKFGREYLYQPQVGDAKGPNNYFSPEGIVNAEIRILTSRGLAEKLIATVGLARLYPNLSEEAGDSRVKPIDRALRRFQQQLTVRGISESNMIRISFDHPDPRLAAEVVNTLIDLFKEKHLQTFNDPANTTFLANKVEFYQKKLKQTEVEIAAFKQQYLAFSFDEQQGLLLRRRSDLDNRLKDAESQSVELEEKLAFLEKQLQAIPETTSLYSEIGNQTVVNQAKSKLLTLQLEEQQLLGKFSENNRQVVQVRKQIGLVNDFLKQHEEGATGRVRIGKSNMYQQLEQDIITIKADLRSQQAKGSILKKQHQQVNEQLQNLTLRWRQFQDLERQRATDETNYRTYVKKAEENKLSNEMDRQKMSNIRVVQAAHIPLEPKKPQKKTNIIVGIMLGVFIGAGLAALFEYMDQGMSTPQSVERRLQLPVLATVSYQESLVQNERVIKG